MPDDVVFATGRQLARTMITDAAQSGTLARRVAGDEVYGAGPHLRATCLRLELGYLAGERLQPRGDGGGPLRADRATRPAPAGGLAADVVRRRVQKDGVGTPEPFSSWSTK
jgi:hypothetical protein